MIAFHPSREGMRFFVQLLAKVAQKMGLEYEIDSQFHYLARMRCQGGPWHIFYGNALGINSDSASYLAGDKDYTARYLGMLGYSTPEGILWINPSYQVDLALKNTTFKQQFHQKSDLEDFISKNGFPLFVKPNKGSMGRDVWRVYDRWTLEKALRHLSIKESHIRIERPCIGQDLRILVFRDKVRAAYVRSPFAIYATGLDSVATLWDRALTRLQDQAGGPKIDGKDPRIESELAAQNLIWQDIPPQGQKISLLPNANLSTGGAIKDISDTVPPHLADLAVSVVDALGLVFAGVDIIAPNIEDPKAVLQVLEVNASPGLDYFAQASRYTQERAENLLQDLLLAVLQP